MNAASEFDADLVAIGSHGRSDLGAAILGGVSQAVAAELDVPVLVVTPFAQSAARPRRVAVAVDGLDGSRQAVAEAEQIADGFGADVIVAGSARRSGVEGLLLGSTARALVQESEVPVPIAAPPQPAEAAAWGLTEEIEDDVASSWIRRSDAMARCTEKR